MIFLKFFETPAYLTSESVGICPFAIISPFLGQIREPKRIIFLIAYRWLCFSVTVITLYNIKLVFLIIVLSSDSCNIKNIQGNPDSFTKSILRKIRRKLPPLSLNTNLNDIKNKENIWREKKSSHLHTRHKNLMLW